MIKTISVTNENGEKLTLKLGDANHESGLLLIDAEGFGPPGTIINDTTTPTKDGVIVNSKRADKRTITLTIVVLPRGEAEKTVRRSLHRYFPAKGELLLEVEEDDRIVSIKAEVEENEPKMFASIEHSEVSLVCPDPYFVDADDMVAVIRLYDPLFEFPFSNESLTEDLLIMGELYTGLYRIIDYPGDTEVGGIFTFNFSGVVGDFSLHSIFSGVSMTFSSSIIEDIVGSPIQNEDVLVLDTRFGKKSATFYRGGTPYNVINALGLGTKWVYIKPGANKISVTVDGSMYDVTVEVTVPVLYGGV